MVPWFHLLRTVFNLGKCKIKHLHNGDLLEPTRPCYAKPNSLAKQKWKKLMQNE